MTKSEQVENIINNHFDCNYEVYKFNCKHWDLIEKEVEGWNASYFDKHIVEYIGGLLANY